MSVFYDHLRSFLTSRLQAFDPTIDLTPDSPAQLEIVEPLIARLGVDPFELDIKDFITQRLEESYPELVINIGELEDLVINPLILLLEPYKQELNRMALGQSVKNAELMDDEELDALGDNWFETREEGEVSSGTARLYFTSPQNVTVTVNNRISSKSGLFFFPVQDQSYTSAQMLFNREGDLYYLDVNVEAEEPGDDYNIDKQDIIAIDDVNGVIKITNLLPFSGGRPRESNTEYAARIEQALTERSLVTKRGVSARIHNLYSSVRAVQVIGAGEEGMNRDILEGTGEGFVHLAGVAASFGNWVLIRSVTYKDTGPLRNITVSIGDTLRFHLPPNVDPNRTVKTSKITKVLWAIGDLYLLEVDKELGQGAVGFAAILKPGYITISKIPGGMLQTSVPDGEVHLGGHSDMYIRPTDDRRLSQTINNLTDNLPVLALVAGATTNTSNLFTTAAPDPVDLGAAGVQVGDSLVIETGGQAGTYKIIEVGTGVRVDSIFTATLAGLRARIVRTITENLNAPKIIKLPFNVPVNDLRTTIGSALFVLDTINIQTFGAVIGDIIEILDGPDAGQFTIKAFDNVLGGQGPIVDRPALATGALLRYRVYTLRGGLDFPLVRVKEIEVLDSSNQPTGIKVPYGDAVDVRAVCDFEATNDPITILDKASFLFPDTNVYWNALPNVFSVPGVNTDARYTLKTASFDGRVRSFTTNGANPVTTVELNLPPFLFDGKKNTIMGFATNKDPNFTNDPSNNPRTSPIAEAKIGDSITLLSGPNAGTYLISDVRLFETWGKSAAGHFKIGVLKIDGEFPTDPIRNVIDFIFFGNGIGSGVATISAVEMLGMVDWATDWSAGGGFYETILIPRFRDTLQFFGFPATTNNTRDILNTVSLSGYTIGPSSHGMLRCYFQEPVTVDMSSDSSAPTLFEKLGSDPVPKRARITTDIKNGQVLPGSFEDSVLSDWLRIGSLKVPVDTSYFLTEGASFAKRGVRTGDIFEFYPAVNDFIARGKMNSSFVCCTTAGSNVITLLLPPTRLNQSALKAGQLLYLESGPDAGQYKITEIVADANPDFRVKVDRVMTHNTLGVPTDPMSLTGTVTAATKTITDAGVLLFGVNVFAGDYITIYAVSDQPPGADIITASGDDTAWLGTFEVTNGGLGFVIVDRSANFPLNADVRYIVHPAPANPPPDTTGGGKELSTQYVRFRTYDLVPQQRTITIDWTVTPNPLDPTCVDQIKFNTVLTTGASTTLFTHKSPFRIIRNWIKRISSTTMAQNREKGLYFFDIPVISIGLGDEFNFKENTAFKFAGNRNIHGYLYKPEDENLTYSTKEICDLIFPVSVLPVGAVPSEENEVKIAGQNVQFIYDNADLIDELQRFFDSPLDRVVACNPLVRHFLPAYVFLEIFYTGGSTEDIIAKDIRDYINSILPDNNELRVDAIARIFQKRTAKQVQMPIELISLVHGLDRKIRSLRSENSIGIEFPVFRGVNKMVYFIPGPDTSDLDTRPNGEQVFLKRS